MLCGQFTVLYTNLESITDYSTQAFTHWVQTMPGKWKVKKQRKDAAHQSITPQVERKKYIMLRKATKVHVYVQCFSHFYKPWEYFLKLQLSSKYLQLKG